MMCDNVQKTMVDNDHEEAFQTTSGQTNDDKSLTVTKPEKSSSSSSAGALISKKKRSSSKQKMHSTVVRSVPQSEPSGKLRAFTSNMKTDANSSDNPARLSSGSSSSDSSSSSGSSSSSSEDDENDKIDDTDKPNEKRRRRRLRRRGRSQQRSSQEGEEEEEDNRAVHDRMQDERLDEHNNAQSDTIDDDLEFDSMLTSLCRSGKKRKHDEKDIFDDDDDDHANDDNNSVVAAVTDVATADRSSDDEPADGDERIDENVHDSIDSEGNKAKSGKSKKRTMIDSDSNMKRKRDRFVPETGKSVKKSRTENNEDKTSKTYTKKRSDRDNDRAKDRATNTTNTMIADTDRKKGEEHTDGTMKGRSSAGKSTSEKKPRKPRVQKLPKSMLFNKRDLPSLYTVQLEDINLDETVHENFLRIVRMRFPDDHPLRFLAEYVNSRQIGDTSMTLTEEQFRSFGAEKSLEFHFRKSQSYFNQLYSIMLRREEPNQFNKYQGVPPTLVFDFRNMFDVFRVLLPHLFNCYTYLESHVSYMRDNLSKWSKTFKSSAAEKREN